MTTLSADHLARAKRFPLPETEVYGYEVVVRYSDPDKKYLARLFAVTTDGRVYTRETNSSREFNQPRAKWTETDWLPSTAAYVGCYKNMVRA